MHCSHKKKVHIHTKLSLEILVTYETIDLTGMDLLDHPK